MTKTNIEVFVEAVEANTISGDLNDWPQVKSLAREWRQQQLTIKKLEYELNRWGDLLYELEWGDDY